jgi:hypothetical protein
MQHDPHVKDEARRLVESLPDDATWDDLLRLIYTQQRVDEGIADLEGGRSWTSDQTREKLNIPR